MDRTDLAIIDRLKQNARANYADIGAEVGLSASAVKRRVDKLVAEGTIAGFTVHVDPAVEGIGTEAVVELRCRGTVSPPELKRMLQGIPEVVQAVTVSGDADAVVFMRAHDVQQLEDALERIRQTPSVVNTRSSIVFSHLVRRAGAPGA